MNNYDSNLKILTMSSNFFNNLRNVDYIWRVFQKFQKCWLCLQSFFKSWYQKFWSKKSLIFPTKRTFEPTVLLLKKAARCQPFLAVVRCLFHNHLRLKRSSLLNVYLNYKFEFSLLTSHLFFTLCKSCLIEQAKK